MISKIIDRCSSRLVLVYKNNQKISKLYKKLDIKIDNPYKLPFNISYNTWGTSVHRVLTYGVEETIIKNISFLNNRIKSKNILTI